jgi:hypothetical protein
MNISSANWTPYPIPQAPNVSPNEKWGLSLTDGAIGGTNPSKFFTWKKLIPKGTAKWEMLYWDPSASDGVDLGNWAVLDAPKEDDTVLKFKDDSLKWEEAIPKGNKLGDILYWDPSANDNEGAWVVLPAPQQTELYGLVIEGESPFWIKAKKFTVCENGEAKDYEIIAKPWLK